MSWHSCGPVILDPAPSPAVHRSAGRVEESGWDTLPLGDDDDVDEDILSLRESMVEFAHGMVCWVGSWMRKVEDTVKRGVEEDKRKEKP